MSGRGAAPDGAPQRLRVLLATPPAGAVGPIPRMNALLAAELEKLGCRVTATDWGSGPGQTSAAGRVFARFRDMAAIWRRARAHDVVVVASAHYGNTLARDIPLLLGLRMAGRPAVLHLHGSQAEALTGPGRPVFRVASRWLAASASGLLVLSSEEKGAWERFRPNTPVHVVKNPYASRGGGASAQAGTSALGGASAQPAADGTPGLAAAPADAPVILFVGRMLELKGVYDLVAAARLLAAGHPELPFQVVMAGDGPELGGIHRAAEKARVAERFLLTGHLAAPELDALYRRAAVLVVPSHLEGFPTVIAEAMDAGLPIVATGIRGAADYLEEGVNAMLMPPHDPARLAEALAAVLADPALRARMSENNRRKVGIFAPDKVAAEYLGILEGFAPPSGGRS